MASNKSKRRFQSSAEQSYLEWVRQGRPGTGVFFKDLLRSVAGRVRLAVAPLDRPGPEYAEITGEFHSTTVRTVQIVLGGTLRLEHFPTSGGALAAATLTRFNAVYKRPQAWDSRAFLERDLLNIVAAKQGVLFYRSRYRLPGPDVSDRIWHFINRPLGAPGAAILDACEAAARLPNNSLVLADLINALLRVLIEELERADDNTPQARSEGTRLLLKEYVGARRAQAITRGSVAAELGLSRDYISHLVRKKTGMTFVGYLTELRLEQARRLLRGGRVSVKEVAADCGFKSGSYFVRVFRRACGVTPGEFARRNSG